MSRNHLNYKHIKMQIVRKSLFTDSFQNVHHLQGHMIRRVLYWSVTALIMSDRKSDQNVVGLYKR